MMDQYHLWDDTMLIVNTDHGFLLGEHGWWGRPACANGGDCSHSGSISTIRAEENAPGPGRRNRSDYRLSANAPGLSGMEIPKDMEGKPLTGVMDSDEAIRKYAVFGYHGSQVDVTDGRYVYMHAAEQILRSRL